MGLSGRKTKQRIGADPRNLTWADDAAKFGAAYLSKLGWDPSRGLGVAGEGRTSHIKVAQKLNMLGIGAGAQQGGKDGIAWKQNRDYELLLKRLNDTADNESSAVPEDAEGEEDGAAEKGVDGEIGEKRKRSKSGKDETGRKKRKKEREETGLEEKADKLEKKKKKKSKGDKSRKSSDTSTEDLSAPPAPSIAPSLRPASAEDSAPVALDSETPKLSAARPRAHRARFLRSKQLASQSSSAVAEILGISASTSTAISTITTPIASGSATPVQIPQTDQELTTSAQSVGDYFKAKLAAKVHARTERSSSAISRQATTFPAATKGQTPSPPTADSEDAPARSGLGAASKMGFYAMAFTTSTDVSSVPQSKSDLGPDTPTVATVKGKMKFGGLMGSDAPLPVLTSQDPVAGMGSSPPLSNETGEAQPSQVDDQGAPESVENSKRKKKNSKKDKGKEETKERRKRKDSVGRKDKEGEEPKKRSKDSV